MDPNRNIQPLPVNHLNFSQASPKILSFPQLQNIVPLQPFQPTKTLPIVQNIKKQIIPDQEFFKKLGDIGNEIKMIQDGIHDEYNNICKTFLQEKEKRIKNAENYKNLKLKSIENSFNQIKNQSENDYQVKSKKIIL